MNLISQLISKIVSCDNAVISSEHLDEGSIVEAVKSTLKEEIKEENCTEEEEPCNPYVPANTTANTLLRYQCSLGGHATMCGCSSLVPFLTLFCPIIILS